MSCAGKPAGTELDRQHPLITRPYLSTIPSSVPFVSTEWKPQVPCLQKMGVYACQPFPTRLIEVVMIHHRESVLLQQHLHRGVLLLVKTCRPGAPRLSYSCPGRQRRCCARHGWRRKHMLKPSCAGLSLYRGVPTLLRMLPLPHTTPGETPSRMHVYHLPATGQARRATSTEHLPLGGHNHSSLGPPHAHRWPPQPLSSRAHARSQKSEGWVGWGGGGIQCPSRTRCAANRAESPNLAELGGVGCAQTSRQAPAPALPPTPPTCSTISSPSSTSRLHKSISFTLNRYKRYTSGTPALKGRRQSWADAGVQVLGLLCGPACCESPRALPAI